MKIINKTSKNKIIKLAIWQRVIIALYESRFRTISELARELRITYSYVIDIVNELEKLQYGEKVKTGRLVVFKFSPIGTCVATDAKNLAKNIGEDVYVKK